MLRQFTNAFLLALACASAMAVAQTPEASETFLSSEPAAVARIQASGDQAVAHTTVALPPPLTLAYHDPCHPCCANCVTYSDFHVDNDGDECCKPAAVIKTHHFVKE
ncbi:hypothetical protein H4R19_005058, partial [Coemansia spiralis]